MVVAVAVVLTLVFSHGGAGGNLSDGGGSHPAAGIASANDTGPVSVITDEPTCDKFVPINQGFANQAENGWTDRDPSIPARDWTPDQRAQYNAMGTTMRNTADQFVALARQTPHRVVRELYEVVRELYEQFTAYARAYTVNIPTYAASDDHLALVAVKASSAIAMACTAISEGSASAWGPSVAAATTPSHPAAPGDPSELQRYLAAWDPVCDDWTLLTKQYNSDIQPWTKVDSRIPATQWTPSQKSAIGAVKRVCCTDR